jgi:UDP-2,4-diacetamido-2,4,6-trideoxy-beta-L-altropyranose hydrolase
MTMKFLFRVDASVSIGSGHVMRCLTLATALRLQGAQCHFACREHEGNLIGLLRQRGFAVTVLPAASTAVCDADGPVHASWLGCGWEEDARLVQALVQALAPDWLVVDSYALDYRWENAVRDGARLLVIDDLADRAHACDLLVDQNLGRRVADYHTLVPSSCRVLAGPAYALLRPEFSRLRNASLARRDGPLGQILVNMGGVDQPNATGAVLRVLRSCELPRDCRLIVVMGMQAPWIAHVRAEAELMPWPTEVLVNVSDMAELMTASDLAIGAAGSTSWERCCLGLPAMMVVLAANQQAGAAALEAHGAALVLGGVDEIGLRLPSTWQECVRPARLAQMAAAAGALVDGAGVERVLRALEA